MDLNIEQMRGEIPEWLTDFDTSNYDGYLEIEEFDPDLNHDVVEKLK